MFICKCNIIKPHCILLMYQDITKLVPKPSFTNKRSTLNLKSLSRDTIICFNDRHNYNKVKFYFTDVYLRKHKEKMQETFYIIKMLSCHDKIDGCNTIDYKYVYDIAGNLGVCLMFKTPEDDDNELNCNEHTEYVDSDADTELMDTCSEINSDADTESMYSDDENFSDDKNYKKYNNENIDKFKNIKDSIVHDEYNYNYDYDYVNKIFDKMLEYN